MSTHPDNSAGRALARQVHETFAAYPELHDQDDWFRPGPHASGFLSKSDEGFFILSPNDTYEALLESGTTLCIATLACHLAGHTVVREPEWTYVTQAEGDPETNVCVGTIARRRLQITHEEANKLIYDYADDRSLKALLHYADTGTVAYPEQEER